MSKLIWKLRLLMALISSTALAAPIAITGGKVYPISGPVIEGGTVVFDNGKITAVGKNVPVPPGAQVIDATGMTVIPGLIDSYTHLGAMEIDQVDVTRDIDEAADPIEPQLKIVDGLFPESEVIPVTRTNGIATVLVAPDENNVINGQSALINLDASKFVDSIIVKSPVGMHVTLGEAPKARYGPKNQMPMSRMGTAALLRQTLIKAKEFLAKQEDYQKKLQEYETKKNDPKAKKEDLKEPEKPGRDAVLEALVPVIKGELPVIVSAHRVDDIETAIRIAEEFNLKLILNHCTNGYKIADLLAQKKIPVLVGPITTQPGSMETQGALYENAALLQKAGVKIAIQSGEVHNVRNLPYEAGIAVSYGLPWEEALKAITLTPAEILGVASRLGSLEPGKDANIAIFDGDPLQPLSNCKKLFINGRDVPLTNYQTELYEKYNK